MLGHFWNTSSSNRPSFADEDLAENPIKEHLSAQIRLKQRLSENLRFENLHHPIGSAGFSVKHYIQGCNIGIQYMDLRHILFEQTGDCAFGFGSASGLCGAEAAAQQAIDHLFLGQRRLQCATAALVSIEAAPNALYLRDTKNIMTMIRSRLPAKACIGYSTVSSRPDDQHDFRVSIFASGIL